ncbi:hypothetical protein IJ843_06980, partial [bacterium]|nr:hypothetical protein [bacterium]
MGMSASQARLLSITSRINDIELKSQQVANIKMRLASESEAVATAYTTALNKQKMTMTSYGANGAQKVNVTVNSLNQVGSNMKLCTRSGKQVVSQSQAKAYQAAIGSYNVPYDTAHGWANGPKDHAGHYGNSEAVYGLMMKFGIGGFQGVREKYNITNDTPGGWGTLINAGLVTQEEVDGYNAQYAQLFASSSGSQIQGNSNQGNMNADAVMVVDDSLLNNANWLYEAIESGEFYIADSSGTEVSISSNTQLAIESDSTDLAKAEAEYNA